MQLYQGDCLECMKMIPDNSIDLVLTDPPYGTMKGAELDGWTEKSCEWDTAIEPKDIFNNVSRVLRPNGKCLLFSQEPYTSNLISNAIPSLPFSYRGIWLKNVHGNALLANKAMVSRCEDICLFFKIFRKSHYQSQHPLRDYFAKEKERSGLSNKEINKILGNGMASRYFTNGEQFLFPTRKMYEKLQTTGFFNKSYDELERINKCFIDSIYERMNRECPAIFNLWQNNKSKSNVLEYSKDNDGYHPTQKPVALLEDLIQTFSNEGDTVLDFTMGSGSTGVACANTNRDFIGIELDTHYFDIAKQRINEAINKNLEGD